MSLWIKVDVQLLRHRKLFELADQLERGGCSLFGDRDKRAWRATAIALLLELWAYAADHHPNGDLTAAHPEALREAVAPWVAGTEWATKDVRELLVSARFCARDRRGKITLTGWREWTGSDLMRLANERKRKQLERSRVRGPSGGRSRPGPALEETRVDKTRTTASPAPAWGVEGDDLLGRLVSEPQRDAVEGLLRAAQEPRLLAMTIASYGPGGTDGRYAWGEIGQAALELVVNGGGFTARRLAAFLRKVHEGEPPARGAAGPSRTPGEIAHARAAELEREGAA